MAVDESLVDLLLDDQHEIVLERLLVEAEEHNLNRAVGDQTMVNYLIYFENYLDDHDIYLFKGWENARVVQKPVVEKFWVTFLLHLDKGSDLRGAKRIINDKEGQNRAWAEELEDGSVLVQFRILKRSLDGLSRRSAEHTDEIASQEMDTA